MFSRASGPPTKMTEIKLKGYTDFIVSLGGSFGTVSIISFFCTKALGMMFKKAAKEEIAEDIFDVISYEAIYGLCNLYKQFQAKKDDDEDAKPSLVLELNKMDDKVNAELEKTCKEKGVSFEQMKATIENLSQSEKQFKEENNQLKDRVAEQEIKMSSME